MRLPLSWLFLSAVTASMVGRETSRVASPSLMLSGVKAMIGLLSFEIEYSILSRFAASMCIHCLKGEDPQGVHELCGIQGSCARTCCLPDNARFFLAPKGLFTYAIAHARVPSGADLLSLIAS